MALVALSGLAMATLAQRSRPAASPRRFWYPIVQPRGPIQVQVPQPRDRSIIVAPHGIDEAMIVIARPGIDDAMIVSPGRWSGGSDAETMASPRPVDPSESAYPYVWPPQPSKP
jgi:hypothetical protein